MFFQDEICVWPSTDRMGKKTPADFAKTRTGRSMYGLLQHLFLGNFGLAACPNNRGRGSKYIGVDGKIVLPDDFNLRRGSTVDGDHILADWFCSNGFNGWHHPRELPGLQEEEMICKPKDCLELALVIKFPKGGGSKMNKKNMNKQVTLTIEKLITAGFDPNTWYAPLGRGNE